MCVSVWGLATAVGTNQEVSISFWFPGCACRSVSVAMLVFSWDIDVWNVITAKSAGLGSKR